MSTPRNRKIDVYYRGVYAYSTCRFDKCYKAKQNYLDIEGNRLKDPKKVTARFDKKDSRRY